MALIDKLSFVHSVAKSKATLYVSGMILLGSFSLGIMHDIKYEDIRNENDIIEQRFNIQVAEQKTLEYVVNNNPQMSGKYYYSDAIREMIKNDFGGGLARTTIGERITALREDDERLMRKLNQNDRISAREHNYNILLYCLGALLSTAYLGLKPLSNIIYQKQKHALWKRYM